MHDKRNVKRFALLVAALLLLTWLIIRIRRIFKKKTK